MTEGRANLLKTQEGWSGTRLGRPRRLRATPCGGDLLPYAAATCSLPSPGRGSRGQELQGRCSRLSVWGACGRAVGLPSPNPTGARSSDEELFVGPLRPGFS